MLTTAEAYVKCKAQIEKHSKTFSRAFQGLPEANRKALWAVYAFCRYADDIVDEGTNPVTELTEFEKDLHLFLENDSVHPSHQEDTYFIWLALQDVFHQFSMQKQPFIDMIEGQKQDLFQQTYERLEDMETYAYYVAGSVGLMLQPILAPNRSYEEMKEGAISLGVAMQLTNILRDVGEDYRIGRVYLPVQMLNRYPSAMPAIETGNVNDDFIAIWEEIALRANELYEKSMTTVHLYPLYSRISVKAAAYLYWKILDKVRKNGYDVFQQRAYVDTEEKKAIMRTLKKEGQGETAIH